MALGLLRQHLQNQGKVYSLYKVLLFDKGVMSSSCLTLSRPAETR